MQRDFQRFNPKWLFYTLALALSALLCACGEKAETPPPADAVSTAEPATDDLAQIKARGVLRVAVFADKPPFGYVDREGKHQGYDVELARRLAKDLLGDENKVEFVLTEAQNRVDVLKSDKVDITLANFTRTPERAEQVDFALPYMKTAIGVVSPKSAPIDKVEALEGKTLVVNKGTTAEIYFTQHHANIPLLSLDHNTEAFSALKDGRGAGLAHDNTLLYAWIKENPDFVVAINQLGPDDVIAPAVKKGKTALLNWVNTEIRALYAEKFFFESYDKAIKPFYGEGIAPENVVISSE